MAIKQVLTIYSQKTGLDIAAEAKENESKSQREGIVQFRFFNLQSPTDGKTTQIKFNCEPWEAYDLSLRMQKVFLEGGKEKITHKFKSPKSGEEIVTNLIVEKWERNGKSGLGISVGRGEDFISVPISMDNVSRFLHAARFLEYLSTSQQWVDKTIGL